MIFVETDESQPTGDLPPDVKYYGKKDTVATNPEVDPAKLGEDPLIKGTQDKVVSTADVPFKAQQPPPLAVVIQPAPVQTVPEPPAPQPSGGQQQKIADEQMQTDAQMVVAETPRPGAEKPAPAGEQHQPPSSEKPQQIASVPQPRIQPALVPPTPEQPPQRQIPSRLSDMTDSSVPRRGVVSLNVKGTPFGVYDEKLVATVSRRWHLMLSGSFYGERSGMVVIRFLLKEDGTIPEIAVEEETVGPVLAGYCRAAIVGSSPFDPFPQEMRVLLDGNHRELNFVFYY